MAGVDVRISELPAATEGHADDRFETTQVDGATLVSRSITLEQVSDAVAAVLPPPSADWDDITGKPATFPPTVPIAWTDITGKPATFPPTIPTGPAIATWPYLPLTGGTLTGTLNGTISNWTGKLTVNVADAAQAVLFRGVSKGVRFLASATEYAIEGVDQSGSGSYQPLRISGTEVRFGAPGETMRLDATGLGIGIMPALSKLHLKGTGQTSASVDTSTSLGATAYLQDTGAAVGNGGMLLFGASQGAFATIKGLIGNGGSNTTGDLVVSTRRATADATLTETARFGFAGNTALAGALTGTTATMTGAIKAQSATAIPAGGTAGAGFTFSSTANFGTIFGSGAPTASAARGSLYLRSDGGGPYVNTDGATAWSTIGGGGAATSVGTTPPGSPANGQLWYYSDAVAGGGALYIYYTDPNTSQWVPASPAATPGSLLQTVFVETGAVATGTTLMINDDTIPQIGEGNEYMTCAITPRSATSRLLIEVLYAASVPSNNNVVLALFQDSTANALAAVVQYLPASAQATIPLRHTMVSGTTSTTTFRVRAGPTGAVTLTFNGYGGARVMGGVLASSIVIQEVA